MYDPSLARWSAIDPMAESYLSQSTYHFSGNNPIKFVDENGMYYKGPDWYQDGYGNEIWFDSQAQNLTSGGIDYTNIGVSNSVYNSGTGWVNYYQNIPVSITNQEIDVMSGVYNNSGMFNGLMNALPSKYSNELFSGSVAHSINTNGVAVASVAIGLPLMMTGIAEAPAALYTPMMRMLAYSEARTSSFYAMNEISYQVGTWLYNTQLGGLALSASHALMPIDMVSGFNINSKQVDVMNVMMKSFESINIKRTSDEDVMKRVDNRYGRHTR